MTASSRFFQPALSRESVGNGTLLSDRLGEVVHDLDDIEQCIAVILKTPRGSVPLRPEFGSAAHNYIDAPFAIAKPNLVREIKLAIELWEPRVKVLSVNIVQQAIAHLKCVIVWAFTADLSERFTSDFALGTVQ